MRAATLVSLLAITALLIGCAGAPRPGVPVEQDRLREIAGRIASAAPEGPLRAAGTGELVVGEERHAFTFALLYDPPAWLRADARPLLGSLSGSLGMAALLRGDTLTVYVPRRDAWYAGRLREAIPACDRVDLASLLVGRPDPALLLRLSRARMVRATSGVVLTGDVYGREVSVTIDTVAFAVSSIDVRHDDRARMSIRYDVAGAVGAAAAAPRAASVLYADGSSTVALNLTFDEVTSLDAVHRPEHALDIPPAASTLGWNDIGLGRRQ